MCIEKKIRDIHHRAWHNNDKYMELLEEAVSICEIAFEKGENSPLFINNYAVVLLDLQRDKEALMLLQKCDAKFSEYCSNYAIALAKNDGDINSIRKWNQLANNLPTVEDAIVAYMDWHGL